jgi:polyhydroxybutyrate depolymerase
MQSLRVTRFALSIAPSAAFALLLAALALTRAAAPNAQAAGASCSPARPRASGDFNETITSGSLQRSYILHVPASYTGAKAVPLLFNLHGYGSTVAAQAVYSGLPQKSDEAGFILISLQAAGCPAHWNITLLEPVDDVGFIRDMLDVFEAQLCIDPARAYSAGMSNGAAMSARLGCSLSDRIVAIAPVAGVYFPAGCSSTRPVSVIAFHGTADPIAPYNGGITPQGFPFPPVETSIASWAPFNGCTSGPGESQVTQNVRLKRYSDCNENATVELYIIDGGGHTWPDATIDLPVGTYGPTTHEISANDLIWEFFGALGSGSVGGVARLASPTVSEHSGFGFSGDAILLGAMGAVVVALMGLAAVRFARSRTTR